VLSKTWSWVKLRSVSISRIAESLNVEATTTIGAAVVVVGATVVAHDANALSSAWTVVIRPSCLLEQVFSGKISQKKPLKNVTISRKKHQNYQHVKIAKKDYKKFEFEKL